MKRFFIFYYIINLNSVRSNGDISFVSNGFPKRRKIEEAIEQNTIGEVKDIVITGFNELLEDDYNNWLTNA